MKKVLIGISGLALLAFVLVLTISAQDTKKDETKVATEAVVEASNCGSSVECTGHSVEKAENCDPAACSKKECDHKNCAEECTGNCDHENCAEECTGNCDPAKCKK